MKKTGEVVVTGQGRKFSLYVYSLHWQHLTDRRLNIPCKHASGKGLLCLEIPGKEYLAISCSDCRDIKLMDLNTNDVTKAYGGEKWLVKMCEGEGNTLYVEASHDQVLELDCTHPVFSKLKTINTRMDGYFKGMTYVPSPHRLLIASNGQKVVAISCETNRTAWRRQKASFDSNPRGLFYSKTHHTILAADGKHSRILVLDPGTGNTLQTIDLPGMGTIKDLSFSGDQLVVRNDKMFKKQISFFSVN